ncbi:AbrB/MazE/SpoVT family DNA-binding domain-containing protein [Candidatus Woesearchaeota archaeon]|nr:AbrB/MazE/SpoVT family DNA-binding domain-containing protein [Candidatus Woesearchaeota archaeon]
MEELVKMSPKGQLVVPQDIREKLKFAPGDMFVAVQIEDGIVFKKIELDLKKIESIKKQTQEQFKK